MAMMVKDPGTRIDFEFDWAAVCPAGQAVAASDWAVWPDEPDGVAVAAMAHGLARATVTLEGGIAGCVYRVTNRVTMTDGQIEERSMAVRVEER